MSQMKEIKRAEVGHLSRVKHKQTGCTVCSIVEPEVKPVSVIQALWWRFWTKRYAPHVLALITILGLYIAIFHTKLLELFVGGI